MGKPKVISIATHLKGEYVAQLAATTVCNSIILNDYELSILIILPILKERSQDHFNIAQDISNNRLIIKESK